MTEERWLPVTTHVGYYEVSNLGRVRSVARSHTVKSAIKGTYTRSVRERILVPVLSNGYHSYSLWREHKLRVARASVLVLEAFVGPRPTAQYGCHRDDDGTHNALTNLYWGTPAQNSADKVANGNQPRGEGAYQAKLTDRDVEIIRQMRGRTPQDALARRFGVGQSQISRIQNNHQWLTAAERSV